MAQRPFVLPSGVDFYAGDGSAAGSADPLLVVSDSTNKVGINSQTPTGTLDINTASASDKGLIVRASASQTANLLEIQNSAGTALYYINNLGQESGISNTYPSGITLINGIPSSTTNTLYASGSYLQFNGGYVSGVTVNPLTYNSGIVGTTTNFNGSATTNISLGGSGNLTNLVVSSGITLPNGAPAVTTNNNLYTVGNQLYFNGFPISGAIGPAGPGGASGNYGSFYDITTQSYPSTTGVVILGIGQVAEAKNVSISGGNAVVFSYPGTYSITYSIQFLNGSNQLQDVDLWLRKNGVDVSGSNTVFTVPGSHAGVSGAVAGSCNYVYTFNSGDYIQLASASNSTSVVVGYIPPQTNPTVPSAPSIILTAQQVMYTQNVGTLTFGSGLSGGTSSFYNGSGNVTLNLGGTGTLNQLQFVSGISIGNNASLGISPSTTAGQVLIGTNAGYNSSGSATENYAINIGYNSAYNATPSATNEKYAINIGYGAGSGLTNVYSNILIGASAGAGISGSTSSQQAIVIGNNALTNSNLSSIGGRCIAIGGSTAQNYAGRNFVIIGNSAVNNSSGQYTIYIGDGVATSSSGDNNVAIGRSAAINLNGGGNTILGHSAAQNLTGSYNVYVGYFAGYNSISSSGSNNIEIRASGTSANSIIGNNSNKINLNYTIVGDTINKKIAIGDVGTSSYLNPLATLQVNPLSATDKMLLLRGVASHAANALEVQNSAGTVISYIDPYGNQSGVSASYASGVTLYNGVPSVTNNVLYNSGSTLYFNGVQLLSGIVGIANGGTALSTTPSNGQLLIGSGSSYALNTLTAGSGISVTNGSGSITMSMGGTGTLNQLVFPSSIVIGYSANSNLNLASGALDYSTSIGYLANSGAIFSSGLNTPIFVGYAAGYSASGVSTNTNYSPIFIGQQAGSGSLSLTTNPSNVGIGNNAFASSSGHANVAIGPNALANTQASRTVAIGWNAAQGGNTYSQSVIIGYQAGQSTVGSPFGCVFIGISAAAGSSGLSNVVSIGSSASAAGIGTYSIHMGQSAASSSSGSYNVYLGYSTAVNQIGSSNISLGNSAGYSQNGSNNISLGTYAGLNSVGSNNVYLGNNSAFSIAGSNNIEIIASGNPIPHSILDGYSNKINLGNTIVGDTSNKKIFIGNASSGNVSPLSTLQIKPLNSTDKVLIVQGAASQTANLQEWQNSAGTILSYIDSGGLYSGVSATYSSGITLPSGIPSVTTNVLYASGSSLYFNGSAVGAGGQGGNPNSYVSGVGSVGWVPYFNTVSGIAISSGQSVYLGTVTSPNATTKTLIAKSAVSQSVNIFEAQNSLGSGLFSVDQAGSVYFAPWSGTAISPVKYDGVNNRLVFTGSGTGASGINLNVLQDSTLSFEATAGQLFSISDGLASGTIFSVNDISGMSSIEVDASGLIKIGEYDGYLGIGTSQPFGQYTSKVEINAASGYRSLILRSGAGSTTNIFEVQNSSSGVLLAITASGAISGAITPTILTSTGNLTLTDIHNGYIIEQTGVTGSGTFTLGTVTIPGWNCSIVNIGSGVIVASGSNTMRSPGGLNKSRTQYSTISIYRRGSNDFVLGGDLA